MNKKKGKLKRTMLRRSMGIMLAVAVVFHTLPAGSFAASASEEMFSIDEQEQLYISHCPELKEAQDETNVPIGVVPTPKKTVNSEGTWLKVGSNYTYKTEESTYDCIVTSSTRNEASVVWKEIQNPGGYALESKQNMISLCEAKGGRLIKFAEYQVLSDNQIINMNNNYISYGCQEYAVCECVKGKWDWDTFYNWTDWSYFIAFELNRNPIVATENFKSEKYYDGKPFEVDTNGLTWKGTVTPTIKYYSDTNGAEISAPSAVGTYYIKLSIDEQVVEDGIRYEASESDYIEITILPIITGQPEDAELYYGYITGSNLSVTAATDGVTYQWYENNTAIGGATQATYTVPTGKVAGTSRYYCVVTLGDYTEKSNTASVTVTKSGTEFVGDGTAKTYNGETPTDKFTVSDTITVIATPTAIGKAPQKALRLRGGFTQPSTSQMAVFVGDTQVSEAVDADDNYTMTVSASDVLMLGGKEPNGDAITLTARFVGNGNMAGAETTVEVNISAAAKVEKDGTVIGYLSERDFSGTSGALMNNEYSGTTVTLLTDVQPAGVSAPFNNIQQISTMVDITCILDLAGHKFTSSDIAIYTLPMGNLTIQDSSSGKNGQVISTSNVAVIRDGVTVLEGGTYIGTPAIRSAGSNLSGVLMNTDEIHYAFFDADGNPILLTDWQYKEEITGPITVQECTHKGIKATSNNNSTHILTCLYCGYTKDAEACTYSFSGNVGTCKECNSKIIVEVSGTDGLVYNGSAHTPGVTVMLDSTQALTAGNDYDVSYGNNTNAGTATVTVVGKSYSGTFTREFTIGKATPDIGTVTAEVLNDTLDVSRVALSRINQMPAGTLALADDILKFGTNTYTWKFMPDDTDNYESVTGTVEITVNDTIAPAAEYQIGTDGWKKFVNTISFGLFCKDYKTVTIRGTDDTDGAAGSGIARTQYYICDKEITDMGNIAWETYTEPVSLNAQGTYFVYVKVTDNAGNTAILNSEGIVIYAESSLTPTDVDYTYKQNQGCTVQLTMNGNTFKELMDNEGNAIGTDNYTIGSNGTLILKAAYLDTLNKGKYTYKVSVNPQGVETDQMTLVYTFTVNVKAKELTVTRAAATDRVYDGTNAVEITAVTLSGVVPNDDVAVDLSGIQGTLSSTNAGTYTTVLLPELTLTGEDKGNYILVQPTGAVATSVKINPLDAEITVGTDIYNKTFGDAAFTLDVTDNNTEADVQYEVTTGTDVVSVSKGIVTIKNVGTATITVSLPASVNYNAAVSRTITVNVARKGGYTVAAMNKSYLYSRENIDSIDLAVLLPKDCGTVVYGTPATSGNVTFSAVPAVNDGELSYTLNSGNVDDEGTITVIIATRNYADITVKVNVMLIDRIPVELKEGTEVTLKNDTLTYGESLSKLVFNSAVFVGNDGKTVLGSLAWKNASETPDAGTTNATWVFTPQNKEYAVVEGTVAIRVGQAAPEVSTAPTVAVRVYNPSITLRDDELSGVTVTGVDGASLEGKWSWQSANIIPTVINSGYDAVFIPADTTNYKTVTRTVAVTVTKAVPYISDPPTAAGITYGETLKDSSLSGGIIMYGNGKGQSGSVEVVTGTFSWKELSTKPAVADSNKTEYTVVFMPSDTVNYSSVETKTTLFVNKADNVPNMPGSFMEVSNSIEKVGSVPLPAGWEWHASDKDTALEMGVPVEAVAVYTGADKGNYKNEAVTVKITRSSCDHVAGAVIYTGKGEKVPTCTEDGLGHKECTVCGAMMESGILVKALGHTGGTANCSQRAVCTRCNQPYGGTDRNRHGSTEVRGFAVATCTAGGYTGDTYCKDCNAKTKMGNATSALGHDYKSEVTKEPTTDNEGERIYACTRCGQSYKENIPRLPKETHWHSYIGSITKEPTCTDTGVRTYICNCGDSYTETIAVLGHHFLSSETKQSTTTAEGVMTYTCDRCGHSYTRAIAKLPDDNKPDHTDNDSTGETGPDTGIPFIKYETGKIGWDVIRAEEEMAADGSIINVDMNGTTIVPGDIFDSIKGRDITIIFDMGGGILWSVEGKDITIDKVGDIDFSVKLGASVIPVDIVNKVTGESYSIRISLAHEGEFGFKALLFINLGKENAGFTTSLYYYNESTGELEFICADKVTEDGTVSLAFTHASDYVIVVDREEGDFPEEERPTGADAGDKSPQTEQSWKPWWILVVGALVIIIGIGAFFVVRKKKDEREK